MTVRELIERLQEFPPEANVQAAWDDCLWDVGPIELFKGEVVLDVSDMHDALRYMKERLA